MQAEAASEPASLLCHNIVCVTLLCAQAFAEQREPTKPCGSQ